MHTKDTTTTAPAGAGRTKKNTRAPFVRVAIVEDMHSYAEMLRGLCQRSWGLHVIVVAHTGSQAYEEIVRTKPDVILLDLGLPDIDGLDLMEKFRQVLPSARIVVVSGTCCDYQLHRLGRLKIDGFVDKFADDLPNLREAIERASRGEAYFSPVYLDAGRRLRQSATAFFKVLSDREQEILRRIAYAKSDMEIGAELGISTTTVQTHRREVMRKLGIHSAPKLVRYAMELGFATLPTLQTILEQV